VGTGNQFMQGSGGDGRGGRGRDQPQDGGMQHHRLGQGHAGPGHCTNQESKGTCMLMQHEARGKVVSVNKTKCAYNGSPGGRDIQPEGQVDLPKAGALQLTRRHTHAHVCVVGD